MKNFIALSLLLFCSVMITSCGDDPVDSKTHDCVFVQDDNTMDGIVDATEQALITECEDNLLTDIGDIESALIGTWELVGHGEGWLQNISQPCVHLTITADELTIDYENAHVDTLVTVTYAINTGIAGGHFLEAHGTHLDPLNISRFSETLMYGSALPVDGNMYLYQKQN